MAVPPASPSAPPTPPPERWFAVVVLAAVVLAYLPALRAGFVWDDEAHVTAPALRSLRGLWRIWFEPGATQQYYPLLHSCFWLEHTLWGDAPLGYHLVNVALHALAASLFALVLLRLEVRGAWFAALVFALHPVHVESVAWISEQKNTLSAVFYLGAALAWLRFDPGRKPSAYALASGLFVLALLTKTVTATLPAALLVVAWWRRGRLSWRGDVRPLVPWFLVGAAAGLGTAWIERKWLGAEGVAFDLTLVQRALLAGRVVWFYLGKLGWPAGLTFFYPRWSIAPSLLVHWIPLLALVAGAAGLWVRRHRERAPLAALLFFVGSLFPVLGLLNVYPFRYSFVADHFQYLASLGVFALAAGALARTGLLRPLALVLLPLLGTLTFLHCAGFRDAPTLYRATLARNPAAWIAWNNLGKDLLADRARVGEAIAFFERALALQPDYFEARNNLGLALTQTGRPGDAIPHLREAVRLKPRSFQARNNLGIALASGGHPEESLAAFACAAELNPALPNIHENWAKALRLLGRDDEAERQRARAAELRTPGRP